MCDLSLEIYVTTSVIHVEPIHSLTIRSVQDVGEYTSDEGDKGIKSCTNR